MTSDTTERRDRTVGPDIAIIGAARAGTSFLSAVLSRHTRIDPGLMKEPNYFSSRWEDGEEWYDHLVRRLTDRPRDLSLFLTSLVSKK